MPFLDLFEKTSNIKICLHTSGPLLDWLEENQKDYLDRIAKLAAAGRIEILSGGYYEPILSLIREEDAVGQIKKMNQYVRDRFKQDPNGFWLTERVWEPSFPSIACKAGLKYTTLDDSHFHTAGVSEDEMDGYFVTENQGDRLFVFPISKRLRYDIPFKTVHEVYEYFKSMHKQNKQLLNLADDGEKFGLWPGTHHSVYKEKWLKHFFKMLEDSQDWLKTTTYSEALQTIDPRRRVYLSNASYEEMMEWSLGSSQQLEYAKFKEKLDKSKLSNEGKLYLRGGFFRNFFAKYPESARMQNKQFFVSKKVSSLVGSNADKAKDELYKGECNCPYWHGIFGGLYLHHLRNATYQHLIQAEKIADGRETEAYKSVRQEKDINLDGKPECIWSTKEFNLTVLPHTGAQIEEWDDFPSEVNLTNVLTRRFEPYHREISERGVSKKEEKASNIHEAKRKITPEIVENLAFDKHERRSWIDRVFKSGNLKQFKTENLNNSLFLTNKPYQLKKTDEKWVFETEYESDEGVYHLTKTLAPVGRTLQLSTAIKLIKGKPAKIQYGSEWNLTFKNQDLEKKDLKQWELKDEWSELKAVFESEKSFNLWQFQIMTISQSESSYNLTPQGVCCMPFWELDFSKEQEFSWNWQIKIEG